MTKVVQRVRYPPTNTPLPCPLPVSAVLRLMHCSNNAHLRSSPLMRDGLTNDAGKQIKQTDTKQPIKQTDTKQVYIMMCAIHCSNTVCHYTVFIQSLPVLNVVLLLVFFLAYCILCPICTYAVFFLFLFLCCSTVLEERYFAALCIWLKLNLLDLINSNLLYTISLGPCWILIVYIRSSGVKTNTCGASRRLLQVVSLGSKWLTSPPACGRLQTRHILSQSSLKSLEIYTNI